MKIIKRDYTGDTDQSAMIQLARQLRGETIHGIDLPYRLSSWALDEPDNVGLWVDEYDRLIGWAVMQTPFWMVDYVYLPDKDQGLHRQILAWADRRACEISHTPYGHPAWYVNVFADQTDRRNDLEQAGFTDQAEAGEEAWSQVWMERSCQGEVPSYPLPTGFTMRPLEGVSEVDAYLVLHQEVFGTKNMTAEWRRRTLQQPGYISDLDIVAAAPDGRLAAFCIGWLSKSASGEVVGQIEPLGCHADFRRYTLGRVVLCEVLQRLQGHGAQSIFVETDTFRNTAFRLYESVGFRMTREITVYGKDYNDPPA